MWLRSRSSKHLLAFVATLLGLFVWRGAAATNLSVWVYPGASGRLIEQPDALGNRIVDSSLVGYKSGLQPLPSTNIAPVKVTISPVAGDNSANIQNAINQVATMPMNAYGFRGAVLLTAGEYPCATSININASGVVLRGVGSFTNGLGTVLRATASNQYSLVRIGGSGSASTSTTHSITNNYVPVGARSFNVDSTNGLAVGDHVYVRRYTTTNWIHDIGMDLLTNPWTPAEYTISMDRVITRIEGNRVFVDNPMTCAIDLHYTNGALIKFAWTGRITNSGIEHIYGKSDYFGNTTNENHGWIFVQFNSIEDGFARDLVSQYFGYSCVALFGGAKHVTVQDCQCLDPISIITGGRRYGFVMDDDTLCVVKNCYTRQDRHQYVTQSMTIGPNVFVDGVSDIAHAEAGPHHRWATAAIWDRITVNGHDLDAQNTCESGTGHGWEGANCVIWNSQANNLKVASPPTARNWLIGSLGTVSKGGDCHGIVSQPGTWDSSGASGPNVFPDSLYFTQLQDRLAAPNLQTREYWLGVIDGFSNSIPRDIVDLDPAWSNAVQSAASGQPVEAFNVVAANHWIPFTFNYRFGAGDRIVGATLSLAMRASVSASGNALYLGSGTNVATFSSLGWLPIGTGTNTTVRVLDLGGQLNLLTNGQFNVAVQGDAGIDWALLELQVAPALNSNTNALFPVADATVRGGTNGASNYGAATTLSVRNDSSTNNTQLAYLRWDLSGVTQTVMQARVSLTPVSVGTNGIEQGAKVAAGNAWSEAGITFNNQPGAGERFATWIPGTNGAMTFDVTPQVLDALNNDKQLSLELYSVRNVGAAGNVDYASREAVNAGARPQLFIVTLGAAPTISDITNLTVRVNGTTGPVPFTIGDLDTPVNTLALSATSSDTNVVPNENIVFGGSGANRTVTVTPAGNKSGAAVITITVSDTSGLGSSDNFTLTVASHAPGTFVWNGPGAGANNWSTSANWLPSGAPESLDDVKFFDAGAGGLAISNINNVVDTSFGGEVASLQYANTNGNHTTLISPGQTLLLSGAGGLVVGTETDNGGAQQVTATVTGPGGTLVMDDASADLIVRQGASANSSQRATLDMSGLDEFDLAGSQIVVGCAGPVIRATGTLTLAKTNNVVVTGAPGIFVGDNSSNGGGQNFLFLGQQNSIFADSIVIGRKKATSTLKFKTGLVNPSAVFRASDGESAISSWSLGDGATISGSSSASIGTNDFSGGTVDAWVNTLTVGRSQQTSGNNGLGVLTYTAGTFNVNTLQIGFQTQSGVSAGIGTVNVGGNASLFVNGAMTLGACGGAASTNLTHGVLNVIGGTAGVNAITVGPGSATNAVGVSGGTLALTNTAGTLALPIDTVALTNASLQLFVGAGVTNIAAGTLVLAGSSNVINIASLNGISGPGHFPLIKYSGILATGFILKLGSWPQGVVAGAYLSNNIVNGTVDLVITNLIVPDPFLTWDGTVSGDWDAETANWKNNVQGGLEYADGEDAVFNDSATGPTIVNLTDTFTPGSVTVSNNTDPYVFIGDGNLSGTMALVKTGAGAMMIANGGNNDFTGDVTINGGVLWVGDNSGSTNGNLPVANNIVDNAALVLDRGDTITVPNLISGTGRLTNYGVGTVTLSGANTFAGGAIINAGTVRAASATALGGGAVLINTNGTLAAGAAHTNTIVLAGGTLGTSVTFTNTQLTAAAGTTSLVRTADPQNPNTSLNLYVGGALHGSGTVVVLNATNVTSTDGNQGFRLTGVAPSDFIGTIVLSNNVKGELQIVSPGTFSPGGAGTFVLNCGNFYGTNGLLCPMIGGYSEFNLRNNSSGDGMLGNDVVLAGNGLAVLNALGSAAAGAKMTMGNLRIGGGQELAVYLASGNAHVVEFQGVTLTSGNAKFSPKPATFGSATQVGGDLAMGPISELSAGSGIIMSGLRTLTLAGVNTYSGTTAVTSGTLALTNGATISSSTNIVVGAGAVLNASGRADGALTLGAGQTLQGNGTVLGNLTNGSGAAIAPGNNAIGTLTVSGLVTLAGTVAMELNRTAGTNDLLQAGAALNYGGTLSLVNLSGALSPGDAFKLFNASSYHGAFANIVPATPAPGLMWDTSRLVVDGTLVVAVAAPPVFTTAKFSGTNLVFGGTNGTRNGIYWLRASPDIAAPINTWPVISTNVFDSNGGFGITNPINGGTNELFYLLQLQ